MAKNNQVPGRSGLPGKGGASGPASKIRHGGRAGKDTATEILERFFRAIFRRRLMGVLLVVVLLGGILTYAFIHKRNVERARGAAEELVQLRSKWPPELEKINEWLGKYKGEQGESEVRFLRIQKYIEIAKDSTDVARVDDAMAELRRFREDFPRDPWVTAKVHLPGGNTDLLVRFETELLQQKEKIPIIRAKFGRPDVKPSPDSAVVPAEPKKGDGNAAPAADTTSPAVGGAAPGPAEAGVEDAGDQGTH